MFLGFLLLFIAIAIVCSCYDANVTEKGIKAGIGVEANSTIDFIARTNKPSLFYLYLYNLGRIALASGLAVFFKYHFPGTNLCYAAQGGIFGVLVAFALGHVEGYRQWQWMFEHPGKRIEDIPMNAWQKFIGFWG
jgi:hypothetical protein